jgi:sugar/nucleoside kinase (ribokinase family)
LPPDIPAARIVVCGDVINDILVKPSGPVTSGSDTPSAIVARPGGSAATQAAWLGYLGADVVFAGRAGARDAAFHAGELTRFGVRAHISADDEAGTGSIVIMVAPDGERTMFTDRGANLCLRRDDLPPGLLDGAAVLHLTGYTFFDPGPREVAMSLVAQARSLGIAFTVDPGSAAFLAGLAAGEFLRWTAGARLCFPNRDEARVLTGESDPVAMARSLSASYDAVVLKLGAEGCLVAVRGEEPARVPAAPAQVRDTTGAGDAFCAAFLSEWLATGRPRVTAAALIRAAESAVKAAATAVSVLGGRPQR